MFHDAPEDSSSVMEAHTDLERALRRLPEEFRTVLLLAEVEGMPLEEVARVMECPVGTVKSRIFRAKRSEEHTSELQSQSNLVCRLLLEKKKIANNTSIVLKQ